MANERQTDLILRAQVDQALQPLSQVTQRVKDLIGVLNQQRDATKSGDTSLGEYAKALRDVEKASGDLLKQRAALDNFATRGQRVDTQSNVVDQRLQRRNAFAATLSDAPTEKEIAALARLDKALVSSQSRLDTMSIAYARATDQLQRLGVLTDELAANQQRLRLDQAHATITDATLQATQALRAGQATNDTLIATLKLANIEKVLTDQRARDTARFLADQEKERQAVIDAAEAVRTKGAAAQAHVDTASFTGALQSGRGISRDDIEAAFAASDAEKALADQRARDAARFLADQERERKAIAETADAIRAQGAASQQQVNSAAFTDSLRAGRGISRDDVEAAFAADEAEKKLAAQRVKDASDFQAQQARMAAAVTSVWEAEDAAAAKARAAFGDFRASVEKAVGQVQALRANAAAGAGALAAPVALPAPTLAAQVKAALAGGPGAATGAADLAGLQAEIARITTAVTTGGTAVGSYTRELKDLDAVSREVVRQSQIVDSFQKQEKATRAALLAVRDAAEELRRLEAVAKGATTPEQLSEVTSAVNAQRKKLGSVDEGTGLLGEARAQQEAFAREQAALNAIGVSATGVQGAMQALTTVAIDTSIQRQAILDNERKHFDTTADDIIRRAAGLSTAASAPTGQASARAAVAAVAGPGRTGGEVVDVTDAVDKLDKRITTAKLTAQSYNKVMDELFAVQRQIASDATLIDSFTAQSAAVDRAKAAYAAAQVELAHMAAAVKAGTADLLDLRRAEATLTGAASDLQRQASQQAAIDAQLVKRKIDTASLTAETDKLVQASQRLAAAQARANQSSGKVFGLSAYQVENLSFQINDVITQLSLGQGVLRTFESQAGQIFQIFETSISAMKNMLLIGAPVAAAIGLVVLALLRLKDTHEAQKEFSRLLTANADGMAYQAKALVETARVIETYGVSFAEATKAVKDFMHDGLSTASMLQFAKTAQNMADVTGGTFVDALKSLRVIATGSYDDIRKLNDEFNFLHASEIEAIKDAFDYGDASKGRTIALNAATFAFQQGREQGIDPLHQGMKNLTAAWHDFLDAIGSTSLLTGLVNILTNVTRLAADTASALRFILNPTQAEVVNKVTLLEDALKNTREQIDRISKTNPPGDELLDILLGRARDLTRQLGDAVKERDKLLAGTPGGVPGAAVAGTPGAAPEVTSARSVSAVALSHLGENAGQVSDFLKPQNLNPLVDAWCAAFANAALREAGIAGSGSNVATSFEKWGQAVAAGAVQAGDILVQARGHAAGEPGGHVGIATGQFKTGPDGALLVEMVSGNSGGLVRRTFENASDLDARRAVGTPATTPILPGVQQNPDMVNRNAAKNQAAIDDIVKKQAADVDELLRGDARLVQDSNRVTEYYKQRNNEIEKQLDGAKRSPELTKAFNDEVDAFARKLADKRQREIDAANNALLQIVKGAQDSVDRANKTDPAAQRRVVDADFAARMSQLNEQIAHGATEVAGQSLIGARDALLKLRDQAREKATIDSDRAIVDTTVKTRDEQVAAVEGDLKTGAISLQAAFDRIAAIVKAFNPAIQQAIGKSNEDLSRQPQTPAIQEQLAKNAKIDATGQKASADIDAIGLQKVNDLIAARGNLVKDLNDKVTNGEMSQQKADEETLRIYARLKPQIDDLTASLQQQLDLQRAMGQISVETYEKMSSALGKARHSSDDLTASQKKLASDINQSIAGNAVAAFDAVATSVGNAIARTGSWSDVLISVGTSFANFTAGVLKDIASMILKQTILNALQGSGGGGSGGGAGGFLASLLGKGAGAAASSGGTALVDETSTFLAAHAGGVVGSLGMSRSGLNPALFVGAPRAHGGGMAGLASGEVPVIVQQGEEILTANNPRHRNNTGTGAADATPQSIRNVVLFKDEDVAGAMAGAHGEKVVFSHLQRNAPRLRQLIGSK